MPRWFVPALFALTLAVLPASAQSGRRPAANANPVHERVETLTGSLRSISSTDLALDTGDDPVTLVQIAQDTKYLSTMDKVKASDFEPGDHVTVEATRDDSGHYHSTTITMNKKGTAEDKENAKAAVLQAAKSPSHSPSSGDTASAQPPAGGASASSSSDSVPSSTVGSGGSRRPAESSQPDSAAPAGDDSAPPVLRRTAPATSNSASAERPSLSAEDVNGVTRAPVAPLPQAPDSNGRVSDSIGDPLIDQTREAAFSFSETLPNYVVKQFTTRYRSDSASRGRTAWQALDIITTDVVYVDGKENYQNIMVNGKPTRDASRPGSWSEGEFASSLQALLSPASATEFRNKRSVTIVNRAAYKYDYTIEQPYSAWRIQTEGQTYQPSYTGAIWIDRETLRVLRIEMAARNMPRAFPIDAAESSIDYDFVLIGDQKYLLPVHSESLGCWRGTAQCWRNVIDFRNYRKYTADTSITFGETAPNK
jgi:hypothetical protein